MIRTFVYILLWLLIMGVAIFASQNLTLVTIKLLAWESIRLPWGWCWLPVRGRWCGGNFFAGAGSGKSTTV
jgi:uncharacterized integral membrane protein